MAPHNFACAFYICIYIHFNGRFCRADAAFLFPLSYTPLTLFILV